MNEMEPWNLWESARLRQGSKPRSSDTYRVYEANQAVTSWKAPGTLFAIERAAYAPRHRGLPLAIKPTQSESKYE